MAFKEIKTLEGHEHWVLSVAFSPDGKTLASAADCIKLWDLDSGKEIRSLDRHPDHLDSVCFSPDGKLIAASDGDRAKLFDVASGNELHADEVVTESYSSPAHHNYTIYRGYFGHSFPVKFVVQRPDKNDTQISLCIPAAFTTPKQEFDGVAVCEGKNVGGPLNSKIGGAANNLRRRLQDFSD